MPQLFLSFLFPLLSTFYLALCLFDYFLRTLFRCLFFVFVFLTPSLDPYLFLSVSSLFLPSILPFCLLSSFCPFFTPNRMTLVSWIFNGVDFILQLTESAGILETDFARATQHCCFFKLPHVRRATRHPLGTARMLWSSPHSHSVQ
jgi:hypothetical protein